MLLRTTTESPTAVGSERCLGLAADGRPAQTSHATDERVVERHNSTSPRARLSAFVISYNRASIIPTCLRALAIADEIVLIDKSSTDETVASASGLVDRIITVPWSPTVEETRAFALTQCTHEWVLFLDDDECLSPEALTFIQTELVSPRADIYEFPVRHYVLGEHDERAYYWPEHHVRLFRRGTVEFSPTVHGGTIRRSANNHIISADDGVCLHHLSHADVTQWIEKTNRYTSRPDRVRPSDTETDLVRFSQARINAWAQSGQPAGHDEYPAAVALLRAIYDIVDRIKIWEEQRQVDGVRQFARICRELDTAYLEKLPSPPRPRLTAKEAGAAVPAPATPLVAAKESANASLDRLDAELKNARRRLEVVQQQAQMNAEELATAERRLRQIETSTIWRASAPVRRAGSRFPTATRFLSRALRLVYRTATLRFRAPLQLGDGAADLAAIRQSLGMTHPASAAPVDAASIVIPQAEQPEVSIIVPAYGKVPFTLRCLRSIAEAMPEVALEVIVAEDASGDPDIARLREVRGIRLIENPENLGFLRSCNAAANIAQGRFLLFLNNDTEILRGAVEAMVRTFVEHPDAGLVGARLVYPDGRLQEAGGIVWNDGSAWNYGRFDDPRKPEYNYLREVDYCSGAAILVPRALFTELGGFDPAFSPAYYEDTDLAFRMRRHGRKVLYQPAALVVHHEGISHGTDLSSGGKAYQVRNRAVFLRRWGQQLRRDHFPNGTHVLRARDRARNRPILLVVDHYVPEPDRDAGSRTMLDTIGAFLEAGWRVKFWPENQQATPRYTQALQSMGVEVVTDASAQGFDQWLAANAEDLDYALLSRPTTTMHFLQRVRTRSRAVIVYYGHDLHFARLRQQAEVTGSPAARAEADRMEQMERQIWREADLSLYLSDEERDRVATLAPDAAVASIVPYCFSAFIDRTAPPPEAEILFVAGFAHPPNVDAAKFLVRDILPLILARNPDARLVLAGSNPTPEVRELAGPAVEVTGSLSDAELAARYGSARVAVVPLRFGAGVKLKIVEALWKGLPLVTTPVGVQGLPGVADIVAVREQPQAFAAAVLRLIADDPFWLRQSLVQTQYARQNFSKAAMLDSLLGAFQKAAERRHAIPV